MNENTTKIITTSITATAGILSTLILGFYVTTAFVGQWWVTPKHRAKALSKLKSEYANKELTPEEAEEFKSDCDYVLTGKNQKEN